MKKGKAKDRERIREDNVEVPVQKALEKNKLITKRGVKEFLKLVK